MAAHHTQPCAWRIIHNAPGTIECREFIVKARTRLAARHKLAEHIGVPLWALR